MIVVRRIALAAAALVVVLLVVAAIFGVSVVRRPFPTADGEISIAGLSGRVTVLRGDRGIPQIYADNPQDLFMAQGFVHAQDRFFEMDLRRHITAGRLSELVGEAGIDTDRVIRTLGWRRVAEAELPRLQPATRRYLQAYADGVNAYIDRQGSASEMSLEYAILGQRVPDYRVERWTPADSLAWMKAMAWDLRSDYDNELMRARLFGRVSEAQINELFPPYPYSSHRPILSRQDWSPGTSSAGSAIPRVGSAAPGAGSRSAGSRGAGSRGDVATQPGGVTSGVALRELSDPAAKQAYAAVQRALDAIPELVGRGDGIGSNAWVVGGNRTSTGKPLLANDPHLGVSTPGIWYQVGLHCRKVDGACPFDVSGFSFAGMPGVVIGHNRSIAWSMTNLAPDVTDFYLEQVRGDGYLRDGKQVPLTMRPETIKVADGAEQTISVRSTVHGPLLSNIMDTVAAAGQSAPVNGRTSAGTYQVALQWTGLQPSKTADALFGLNTARSFADFRAAAKDFAVPSQNLLYADTEGNIGYQAPGLIPVRSRYMEAAPGFWARPGWVSSWDWKGWVPFEELPYSYNPPEGFLVTANQAVTSSGTPFLTTQWDYGYRSERIRALLEQNPAVTPEQMSQLQGDTRNDFAPVLVKALLDVDLGRDDFTKQAQDLLRGWNFTNPAGNSEAGAAAAYYNAVWSNLLELTFNDELPVDLRADGGDQWMQATRSLLEKPRSTWWDDKGTPGVTEGQAEIMRLALVNARLQLTEELGKDPESWEWGKLHRLTLEHKVLGSGDGIPGVVQWLFNRGPFDMPGGSAIVNANGWNASEGFTVNWAPSMRMVVDLSNLDRSRWVNQTGNSGHAFHENYDDQTEAWIKNELFDWPFTEKAVREAGFQELTLSPQQDS